MIYWVFVVVFFFFFCAFFFFQAEDGIRDLVRSRGLGDVYKRQLQQLDHAYSEHYYGEQEKKFFSPFELVLDYFRKQRARALTNHLAPNAHILDLSLIHI